MGRLTYLGLPSPPPRPAAPERFLYATAGPCDILAVGPMFWHARLQKGGLGGALDVGSLAWPVILEGDRGGILTVGPMSCPVSLDWVA